MQKLTKLLCLCLVLVIVAGLMPYAVLAQTETHHNETGISQQLIDKADPYVKIQDGQFQYIENQVLTANEEQEVLKNIEQANNHIREAKQKDAEIVQKENSILLSSEDVLQRGYGFNGVEWHWWGLYVYLNQDLARAACNFGVATAINKILSFIPYLGYILARSIAFYIGSVMCRYFINSGVWVKINYPVIPTGWGCQ